MYHLELSRFPRFPTSQTINLTNQPTEADILRRRMDASVLLIKALGGGWNLSNLPSVSSLQ